MIDLVYFIKSFVLSKLYKEVKKYKWPSAEVSQSLISGSGVAGVSGVPPGAPGPRSQQTQHWTLDPGPGWGREQGASAASAADVRNPLLQTS